MRPRLNRAWAALLTAACGSSSGSGLFTGGNGIHPATEGGTDPEQGSGGRVAEASGGRSPATGGAQLHPTGGTAGTTPGAGGTSAIGGAGGDDHGGTAGSGAAGDGSAGMTDTGGASGYGGGFAGQSTGGAMTGSGGSAGGATPHTVACGAKPCQVGSQLTSACCVSGLSLATVCIPTLGAGCANGGAAVTCDDAADCADGEVCCGDSVGMFPITVCAKNCKAGQDQLCRTDDECKGGGGCGPIDAQPEYSHCN